MEYFSPAPEGNRGPSATWSVAATVRAPAHQVNEFIDHYLRMGADRIFLFFDDPAWSEFDGDLGDGRVRTFVCDGSYWRSLPDFSPYVGGERVRPENIETRQSMNMLYARAVMPSAWLLHVDVDELLWCWRDVGLVLSELPRHVFSMLVRPLEAVYPGLARAGEEFSAVVFKRFVTDPGLVSDFYSDELAPFLDGGLVGHSIGKTFVRKEPLVSRMSVHQPVPADPSLVANVETHEAELLHFEGQSFELFKEKSLLRQRQDFSRFLTKRALARAEYVSRLLSERGEEGLELAYRQLYTMDQEQIAHGLRSGFLVRRTVSQPREEKAPGPSGGIARAAPSQWQGRVLRTMKGLYVVLKRNDLSLRVEKPGPITREGSKLLLVEASVDSMGLLLLVRTESAVEYLARDKTGQISTSRDRAEAAVFEQHALDLQAGSWVSLRLDGHALAFDQAGRLKLDRTRTTWRQCFQVKQVLPQL